MDFGSGRAGGLASGAGLGTERASVRHRLTYLAVAAFLCSLGALAYGFSDVPLTPLPGFIPAFLSAVIVTEVITAYLLFAHAPLSDRFDLLWLGGAYLFSSCMAFAQLTVFPGVLAANGLFGAGPQSAVWLWVFWHGGFPTLIIVAMLVRHYAQPPGGTSPGSRHRPARHSYAGYVIGMIAFILAIAVTSEMLVTRFQSVLPSLIQGRSYANLTEAPAGHVLLVLNLAALPVVLYVTRCRSLLDLGLVVAVLAFAIDSILTLRAGARFSIGWYVSRMGSSVCAVSVLIYFLRDVTTLYARLLKLNTQLMEQATIDGATGLFNRRHFNKQLLITLRDGARRTETTGLLMIDIDHFKCYNDHYGHLAGDACLLQVAQAIACATGRPRDVAARYGGEEFAIILPTTGLEGSRHMAKRVIAAVEALRLEHAASATAATVTVSIGLYVGAPGVGFDDIILGADEALYAAKRAGRDRLVENPPGRLIQLTPRYD